MRLTDLPGVGDGLATRIAAAAGDEGAAMQALQEGELDAFTDLDGVSEQRLIAWARHVRGSDDTLLGTDAARRMHERLLDTIATFAPNARARRRVRLLPFFDGPAEAAAHCQQVMSHRKDVAAIDAEAVAAALRHICMRPTPKPVFDATRMVIAADREDRERLRAAGLDRWISIAGPSDLDRAADHEVVIWVGGDAQPPDLDQLVEVSPDAGSAEVAPHQAIAVARAWQSTLQALGELATLTGRDSIAPAVLEALPVPRSTGRIDVAAAVEKERQAVEARLDAALADLSIGAGALLRSLAGGALPPEVQRIVSAEFSTARANIRSAIGVDVSPFVPGLPVEVDEDAVREAQAKWDQAQEDDRYAADVKAAQTIEAALPGLDAEVAHWIAYENRFTLGRFADALELQPATIGDSFAFQDSIHLDLAAAPDAQRIAYHLGETERVALLTGANSGGKSTLLEHLCQLTLMARMGLPVVGRDVTVPWVDELHLLRARKGLDAGALETFLRTFLPVASGDAKRLVLADEVEAVTELDAAAQILSFVLERLQATQSIAVVATHLADHITRHIDGIRVDGIEAAGLDDQHRLIVDRTPKIGRAARSTPELVVARLAQAGPAKDRALFAELHARLTQTASGPDEAIGFDARARPQSRPSSAARSPRPWSGPQTSRP